MQPSSPAEMEFISHDARGPSRRTLVVAVVVLIALVVLGLLGDRWLRANESAELERCAQQVHTVVPRKEARVTAMAAYVRPALYGNFPGEVGDGLSGMISREAQAVVGAFGALRAQCSQVSVFFLHDDLQRRKAACVGYLDAHEAYLQRVAEDGLSAFQGTGGSRFEC